MRQPLLLPILLSLCLAPPLAAQSPAAPPLGRADALWMEPGLVLVAAPPRQLTLNAHVQQFLYRPGSDTIAYVSVGDDGATRTTSLRLIDARRRAAVPETVFRVMSDSADTKKADPDTATLILHGWSADGGQLLLQEDVNLDNEFLLCNVSSTSSQIRTLPQPPTPPPGEYTIRDAVWSPDRHHILLTQESFRNGAMPPSHTMTAEIYDPATSETQVLSIADDSTVLGWQDQGHLMLVRQSRTAGQQSGFVSHDITTDKDTLVDRPKVLPSSEQRTPGPQGLTLEVQRQTLTDAQGAAQTDAQSIWIRREKAPRAASALTVTVTPGSDDPQAQWAPDGNSVAFVAHGDLFVSALSERDATPRERLAAGEVLDCAEERQLAVENLRQIGRGILRYAQEHGGHLPARNGLPAELKPYLTDETVFALAGNLFVYREPQGKTLKSVSGPSRLVLGTMDLPCARLILRGDGHVETLRSGHQT